MVRSEPVDTDKQCRLRVFFGALHGTAAIGTRVGLRITQSEKATQGTAFSQVLDLSPQAVD